MSIVKKLKFAEGNALIINMPDGCNELFKEVAVSSILSGNTMYSQVLLFAKEK